MTFNVYDINGAIIFIIRLIDNVYAHYTFLHLHITMKMRIDARLACFCYLDQLKLHSYKNC